MAHLWKSENCENWFYPAPYGSALFSLSDDNKHFYQLRHLTNPFLNIAVCLNHTVWFVSHRNRPELSRNISEVTAATSLIGNILLMSSCGRCLLFANSLTKPSVSLISTAVIKKDLIHNTEEMQESGWGSGEEHSVPVRRFYCTAAKCLQQASLECPPVIGSCLSLSVLVDRASVLFVLWFRLIFCSHLA